MRKRHAKLFVVAAALLALVTAGLIAPSPLVGGRWWLYRRYSRDVIPIAFYGRVVDQRGDPIQGARVQVDVTTTDISYLLRRSEILKTFPVEAVTGPDGTFTLSGIRGRSMQVETITRDGYVPVPERYWMETEELRGLLHYRYGPSYGPPLTYTPSPANPAVFPLRRANEPPTSQPSRGGLAGGAGSAQASGGGAAGGVAVCLLAISALVGFVAVASRVWHKRRMLCVPGPALAAGEDVRPIPVEPVAYQPLDSSPPSRDVRGLPDTSWKLDRAGKVVWILLGALVGILCLLYALHLISPPYRSGP